MNQSESPIFLDTNVIVRYLTNKPLDMAEAAGRIIDSDQTLILSETILAETAYVLASFYQEPRSKIVDALSSFILRRNIQMAKISKALTLDALLLCRESKRHSFADALLWAEAQQSESRKIYTFDRRFPAIGVDLIVPA